MLHHHKFKFSIADVRVGIHINPILRDGIKCVAVSQAEELKKFHKVINVHWNTCTSTWDAMRILNESKSKKLHTEAWIKFRMEQIAMFLIKNNLIVLVIVWCNPTLLCYLNCESHFIFKYNYSLNMCYF